MRSFTQTAISSASAIESGMVPSANTRLLTAACQNTGSASMARYWSRPTKAAGRRGLGVDQKLSTNVASAGQWVNSASSAIAGSSSNQPWMA